MLRAIPLIRQPTKTISGLRDTREYKDMLRQSIKNYISFGIFLFLLAGLVFAVYLARYRQEIRKKAATPGGLGSVYLSTPQSTYSLGDIIPVEIKFRTGSSFTASAKISMATFIIQYPFYGDNPELEMVNQSGDTLPSGGVAFYPNPDLPAFPEGWQAGSEATRWVFPVNKFYTQGKTVKIEIAGVDTYIKGTRTPTYFSLGTYYLKVKSVPVGGNITFSFDPLQSKLLTKDSPIKDILDTPQSLILAIQEVSPGSSLTPTVTPRVTPSVTPSVIPSVTPSVTPTMTPSPTPVPPLLRLKVGWNKIIWPGGVSKTTGQLPTVCPTAVNKRTIFSDFFKNYWATTWSFISGRTYYIKCDSVASWQL